MFTVYVILDLTGQRYTGHTSDIVRRLAEHNSGTCKTTKTSTGWSLGYSEEYATRGEAMKREKCLKSGTGREFLNRVLAGWSPPQAE